jgi:hypothetical protein
MDGEKFDDLLKRLCTTRLTRISALRGLVAGAAAALTGAAIASDETDAKKKRGGAKKGAAKKGRKGKSSQRVRAQQVEDCGTDVPDPREERFPGGEPPAGCRRINNPSDGCQIVTANCGCQVEFCVQGDTVSFGPVEGETACLVRRVAVKGGPNQNVYTFDPPVCCAEGLTTPDGQEVSHFDFCDLECCEPADLCEEEPCGCTANGRCRCEEVICPDEVCKENCRCVNDACVCDDVICPDPPPGCVNLGCINDECRFDCPDEGCTPGFWKNHPEAWEGFSPNQTLESVFDVPNSLGLDDATLIQALSFQGGSGVLGAARNLLRAAVAALLNAASSEVDYPLSVAQVIQRVNAALASGNRATILALAAELDALNNAGCPL